MGKEVEQRGLQHKRIMTATKASQLIRICKTFAQHLRLSYCDPWIRQESTAVRYCIIELGEAGCDWVPLC